MKLNQMPKRPSAANRKRARRNGEPIVRARFTGTGAEAVGLPVQANKVNNGLPGGLTHNQLVNALIGLLR